jgi:iron-sulfur cluster assembly protein
MLSVSDKAASKLKELMAQEQKSPAEFGLRLGVMGGGCSGLQYLMEFDTPRPDDQIVRHDGVQVLVDPRSLQYVDGSRLDYVESLMGAGFKLVNPNEKGSCGCGHSFTV